MLNTTYRSLDNELKYIFPPRLSQILVSVNAQRALEEIRIRVNRQVQLIYSDGDEMISDIVATADDCARLLINICEHSIYAREEELKQGFVTIGGCRIGLCGRAITERGHIKRLADVTGFNIRIAREVRDAAKHIIKSLIDGFGRPVSSLLISPPGTGKTPALREMARRCSDGVGVIPKKVCVVDERNELSGSVNGIASLDLGCRTDILTGCPKADGMMMAVRSMSPEILLTDELGNDRDAAAALEAVNCGIALIASAHASDMAELRSRPSMNALLSEGAFKKVLRLTRDQFGIHAREEPAYAGLKVNINA